MEKQIMSEFPRNEIEFDERFSTEESCHEYLYHLRWPEGFTCTKCQCETFWRSKRDLYICTACEHQHSVTAGTIMHGTQKPLKYWFKAMWWFATRKSGVNAINLKELLGISYQTAWTWLHKLRSCTICEERDRLSGVIEVDESYIGGVSEGKRGRGSENKIPVAIAVEKKGQKLGRVRIQVIEDCGFDSLNAFINENLTEGSVIKTDGWAGYKPLDRDRYSHDVVNGSKIEDKSELLPGVHRIASLVDRLILSTFQGNTDKKHLQKYLDEYVFRFNRRTSKYVGKKFFRMIQQVAKSNILTAWEIVGRPTPNVPLIYS